MKNQDSCSISNIYQLDGRVPVGKAIPFGLQHILSMFVSNLAPIILIAGSAQPALTQARIAVLLQNAMFVAGIATLIQLYPVWKVGSRLPVVMGVSFTFVTILSTIAANYGYPAVVGAVLIGGLFEGTLGLLAKYWRKIITPVVAASVVTAIGFSLFTVGTRSFGGGYAEDFGSSQNLILGTITLLTCLLWNIFAKGYLKQLSVLAGLVVGYVLAIVMGKVDLSLILSGGLVAFPTLLPVMPEFHPGAILSACIIFLVSAAETIGDTSALVSQGLNREITGKEVAMTKVVNRFTIMMFGTILTSGVQMIAKCGFSQRNITIISLSLAIGIGFTTSSEIGIWNIFPPMVQSVFASNVVAVAFVVSVFLSIVLPKDMDIKRVDER